MPSETSVNTNNQTHFVQIESNINDIFCSQDVFKFQFNNMPEEDEKPDDEQETHRIDMADWLKPPDPWILVYDFAHRLPYYHNKKTHESQWTLPTES